MGPDQGLASDIRPDRPAITKFTQKGGQSPCQCKNILSWRKNAIIIAISHIYSQALYTITFSLSSSEITIYLPKERVFNISKVLDVKEEDGTIIVVCNNATIITIIAQTVYPSYRSKFAHVPSAFPFISADFSLKFDKILSNEDLYFQLQFPEEVSLLSNFTKVRIEDIWFHDIWEPNKSKRVTYSCPLTPRQLQEGLEISFRARSRIERIIFGVVPLILPLLVGTLGVIMKIGTFPQGWKTPIVFISAFLAFTPFYVGLLLKTGAWISFNFSLIFYGFCYLVSILFVLFYFYPKEIFLKFVVLFGLFVLEFFRNVAHYYAVGEFKVTGKIFLILLEKLVKGYYRRAWKK